MLSRVPILLHDSVPLYSSISEILYIYLNSVFRSQLCCIILHGTLPLYLSMTEMQYNYSEIMFIRQL